MNMIYSQHPSRQRMERIWKQLPMIPSYSVSGALGPYDSVTWNPTVEGPARPTFPCPFPLRGYCPLMPSRHLDLGSRAGAILLPPPALAVLPPPLAPLRRYSICRRSSRYAAPVSGVRSRFFQVRRRFPG